MTSVMIPPSNTSAHPCPCGCAECAGSCCELVCLEQPRFFCGQLLTDQDLTALLDWTKNKFRLGRFRHGWGIACGLEVAADVEQAGTRADSRTSRIVVRPGYALSCCGDDLVLCEPATLDLGQAFESGKHQCEEPRQPQEGEPTRWNIGGLDIPREEVRVVDVFLRYQQELIGPQPVLAGACGQAGGCEYTRAREVAKLDWQCVKDPEAMTSSQAEAEAWQKTYDATAALIDDYEKQPIAQRAAWLRKLLNTPHFRFARHLAETMVQQTIGAGDEAKRYEVRYDELPANHPTLLFWLVQEQRNALLLKNACYECDDNHGLPLARVWLRATYDSNGRRSVDVLLISTAPPYRRPLSKNAQRWPAPAGQINLAQFIWRHPEEAQTQLGDYSISVDTQSWSIGDIGSLKSIFSRPIFAPYDGDVTLYVLDTGMTGQRIVGFSNT